jgi:hypothetical protein
MVNKTPIDPEKYTIQVSKNNYGDFVARCIEIPQIAVSSLLEGEAIYHCREFILDYINWCLDNGFLYPEPEEEIIESTRNWWFLSTMSAIIDTWKELK